MHSDVDQCETSTTELTHDSELYSFLSSEAPKPRELPVKTYNLESFRMSAPALMLQTQINGNKKIFKKTGRRKKCAAPPPRRLVFPQADPSRRNPGSVLRSHAQRVSGLLKKDEKRAEFLGNSERCRSRAKSERLRPSSSRTVYEKLSAVGAGYASKSFPKDICCSCTDGEGGERRKVSCDACCSQRNVLEAHRIVQPDSW